MCVAIYNVDLLSAEDEIERSIRRQLEMNEDIPIQVSKIREVRNGQRSTIVRLSSNNALKLIALKRLMIGWSMCSFREWFNLPSCYNCQKVGHIARFCKEMKSVDQRCFKCRTTGHISAQGMPLRCPKVLYLQPRRTLSKHYALSVI